MKTTKKEIIVKKVQEIVEEYSTKLTLRQIYYRLVSKLIIENKSSQYQRLSRILVEARYDGSISWRTIEDRTRAILGGDITEESPREYFKNWLFSFKTCYEDYKLPKWLNQEEYIEVWLEKQALSSLFEQVTDKYGIVLYPCRGYSGHTLLWEASKRFENVTDKKITVLYFGDFDPSGMDIYRFVEDTMKRRFGIDLTFKRIAITQDQINEYDIPPMPTKKTDSRSEKYIELYGDIAVELDAIEPDVLQEIIENSIKEYFDNDIYKQTLKEETHRQGKIENMINEVIE